MDTLVNPVEAAYRQEHGQVVASLIKMTGDWDVAEDAAQEAISRALEVWPREGVPSKPGAWLMTVARRHALDRLRRGAVGAVKEQRAFALEDTAGPASSRDDRLELIFTCCHPALPLENQIALTLRSLAGLTTAQIAAAFLVSEAAMSRRLARAKQKIREAGIPFRVPRPDELDRRVGAVLGVLYLVFNQGYGGSAPLRSEAIDLARLLGRLMPDDPEVMGLLALMLLQQARAASRYGADGALVPLEEQDRALWDQGAIDEGRRLLDRARARGGVGPYQLQAAIAAAHATAKRVEDTDWEQIASLYGSLAALTASPVIELNRAVAVAMAGRPAAALDMLAPLSPALRGYYLLPATRADLLRRMCRHGEAEAAYRAAVELAPGESERKYLLRRLAEVS